MNIWQAAEAGDLERVRAVAEQDAGSVQAQDVMGWTALLHAARGGRVAVVVYLVAAGADIDQSAPCGWTALHEACWEGHAGVASLLLQRGADATAVTHGGTTALSVAALDGHDAAVRVMLENSGSGMDRPDHEGLTAMHFACLEGHAGVLRQLLEAGADPTLRADDGRTAADLAVGTGHHHCMSILQEWDRAYLLQRARRLRDAASTLVMGASQQQHSGD